MRRDPVRGAALSADTQVWIYRDAEFKEVVVSFRGTEQVKWKDFLTDLRLSPVELDIERAGRG